MGIATPPARSLTEFRRWLADAPAGTLLTAPAVLELLDRLTDASPARPAVVLPGEAPSAGLWSLPADARLSVVELARLLGRTRSFVYRAVSAKACATSDRRPLPARRLAGQLQFRAGDVRAWVEAEERRP